MGLADREYTKRDKEGKLQCLPRDTNKSVTNNKTRSNSLGDKIICSLQSLYRKIKNGFKF